jgi:hypothetical protein
MGWLLCRLGRHAWQHRGIPDVGGPAADYEVCTRCNKERDKYDPPPAGAGIAGIG